MSLREIGIFDEFQATMSAFKGAGAFLVTGSEKPNIMTIGWGTVGIIWGKPIFTVLVRPSRYTFEILSNLAEFTVCLPLNEHAKMLGFCGSKSGSDFDKFKECGFKAEKSLKIDVPHIAECPVHYECRVIHTNNVMHKQLNDGVISKYYPGGDFHTIYYGEILGVFKKE